MITIKDLVTEKQLKLIHPNRHRKLNKYIDDIPRHDLYGEVGPTKPLLRYFGNMGKFNIFNFGESPNELEEAYGEGMLYEFTDEMEEGSVNIKELIKYGLELETLQMI